MVKKGESYGKKICNAKQGIGRKGAEEKTVHPNHSRCRVASAAAAILQLLRLVLLFGNRNRD